MITIKNDADIYQPRYVALWLLAAFKAGFLNTAGFFALGSFVSHITGFGTQLGIALVHNDYFFGVEILFIPIAFILGGVLTAWVLDGDCGAQRPPRFYLIQGLITLLIGLVIILGEMGFVSFIGEVPVQTFGYGQAEFLTICLLAFVCGLKNSLVTWATRGKIRVTHLTGLSTDIGLNLVKMLQSRRRPGGDLHGRRVNYVRILTFLAFSVGACGSALIMPTFGYHGFFVAMAVSLLLTVISVRDHLKQKKIATLGLGMDLATTKPASDNFADSKLNSTGA